MKHLKKLTIATTAAWLVALAPAAHAQSTMDASKMDGTKTAQITAAADMTDGEVRKIDIEAGKLTLKHGEIKNLGMPGMTMVFQLSDAAMADKLKAGDKVRFTADKQGSAFVVTRIDKP